MQFSAVISYSVVFYRTVVCLALCVFCATVNVLKKGGDGKGEEGNSSAKSSE